MSEATKGQVVTVKGSRIRYEIAELNGARLDPETFEYHPAANLVREDRKYGTRFVSALWENVTPA